MFLSEARTATELLRNNGIQFPQENAVLTMLQCLDVILEKPFNWKNILKRESFPNVALYRGGEGGKTRTCHVASGTSRCSLATYLSQARPLSNVDKEEEEEICKKWQAGSSKASEVTLGSKKSFLQGDWQLLWLPCSQSHQGSWHGPDPSHPHCKLQKQSFDFSIQVWEGARSAIGIGWEPKQSDPGQERKQDICKKQANKLDLDKNWKLSR